MNISFSDHAYNKKGVREMKYLAIILSITISILFLESSTLLSSTDEPSLHELEKLLELAAEQDVNLSNWQITIKENREIEQIDRFIKLLEGYNFSKDKNSSSTKWQGNRQEKNGINESILIVRTSQEYNKYQISYTIGSQKSTSDILFLSEEKVNTVTNKFFTENAQYFACIELWKSGIIDIACFLNFVESKFNMSLVEEVKETSLKTWTGLTPVWNNELKYDNKEINFQIAIRKQIEDRTTIQIGTPILINEY